jgi:hypothetical protein
VSRKKVAPQRSHSINRVTCSAISSAGFGPVGTPDLHASFGLASGGRAAGIEVAGLTGGKRGGVTMRRGVDCDVGVVHVAGDGSVFGGEDGDDPGVVYNETVVAKRREAELMEWRNRGPANA